MHANLNRYGDEEELMDHKRVKFFKFARFSLPARLIHFIFSRGGCDLSLEIQDGRLCYSLNRVQLFHQLLNLRHLKNIYQ